MAFSHSSREETKANSTVRGQFITAKEETYRLP